MAENDITARQAIATTRPIRRSSYHLNQDTMPSSIAYIYAIGCCEYIKIGIAGDVNSRLSSMKTGNPFHIYIITKMWVPAACAGQAEHMAHDALLAFHHRDEWFKCSILDARLAIREATNFARKEFFIHLSAHAEKERAKLAKRATELLANSDWLRSGAAEGRQIAIETLAALEEMATGVFHLATIPEGKYPTVTDKTKSKILKPQSSSTLFRATT